MSVGSKETRERDPRIMLLPRPRAHRVHVAFLSLCTGAARRLLLHCESRGSHSVPKGPGRAAPQGQSFVQGGLLWGAGTAQFGTTVRNFKMKVPGTPCTIPLWPKLTSALRYVRPTFNARSGQARSTLIVQCGLCSHHCSTCARHLRGNLRNQTGGGTRGRCMLPPPLSGRLP